MGYHCVSQAVTLLSQRLGVMADYQFEWVERCLEMGYFWICDEDNFEHLACWTATVGDWCILSGNGTAGEGGGLGGIKCRGIPPVQACLLTLCFVTASRWVPLCLYTLSQCWCAWAQEKQSQPSMTCNPPNCEIIQIILSASFSQIFVSAAKTDSLPAWNIVFLLYILQQLFYLTSDYNSFTRKKGANISDFWG